jgi:hypothetical protein
VMALIVPDVHQVPPSIKDVKAYLQIVDDTYQVIGFRFKAPTIGHVKRCTLTNR